METMTHFTNKELERRLIKQHTHEFLVQGGQVKILPTIYDRDLEPTTQTWYHEGFVDS